jgi:hypothetical protein
MIASMVMPKNKQNSNKREHERHHNLPGRAALCRSNVGGNAGNGTLLCSAPREAPRRCVVPGCQFAVALSLRYSVRPSKRASLASVTASKRHCAPSISNTPALSHGPLVGLNSKDVHEATLRFVILSFSKRGQSVNRATLEAARLFVGNYL